MRVAVGEVRGQSYEVEETRDLVVGCDVATVDLERFGQRGAHGHARAQRADRVLEHHRDPLSVGTESPARALRKRLEAFHAQHPWLAGCGRLASVVLPEPLSPTTASVSPLPISSETPRTTLIHG